MSCPLAEVVEAEKSTDDSGAREIAPMPQSPDTGLEIETSMHAQAARHTTRREERDMTRQTEETEETMDRTTEVSPDALAAAAGLAVFTVSLCLLRPPRRHRCPQSARP